MINVNVVAFNELICADTYIVSWLILILVEPKSKLNEVKFNTVYLEILQKHVSFFPHDFIIILNDSKVFIYNQAVT